MCILLVEVETIDQLSHQFTVAISKTIGIGDLGVVKASAGCHQKLILTA